MCGSRDRSRWQCAHRETARRRAGSESQGVILFPAAGIFFYGLYYVNLCLGFHALDGGSYGAQGQILTDSVFYGRILLVSFPLHWIQRRFQAFSVTAGKPSLSFWTNVASGMINLVFDYIFIVVFGWALAGAAWATVIAEITGGLLPVLYFLVNRKGVLYLSRPRLCMVDLLKVCSNGVSQFLTGFSMSFLAMAYNYQLPPSGRRGGDGGFWRHHVHFLCL